MMAAVSDIGRQLMSGPRIGERLKQLLVEQDRIEGFETEVYRRDGRIIWISINARVVRDARGCHSIMKEPTKRSPGARKWNESCASGKGNWRQSPVIWKRSTRC